MSLPLKQPDITRADVIQWEAKGSPMHFCGWNHVFVRTGLDNCCTTRQTCNHMRTTSEVLTVTHP